MTQVGELKTQAMAVRTKCVCGRTDKAEAEHDVAVDEAARALLRLQRLEPEVQVLRQELQRKRSSPATSTAELQSTVDTCKESVDQNVALKRRPNDQVLWHLGEVVDELWRHLKSVLRQQPSALTPAGLKLFAVETFKDLVPRDERYLYKEMHELYTALARHENQHKAMVQQIDEFSRLKERLQRESRAGSLEGAVPSRSGGATSVEDLARMESLRDGNAGDDPSVGTGRLVEIPLKEHSALHCLATDHPACYWAKSWELGRVHY